MNCDGIREKLSALIDGELPDEIAAVVERHLEICVECARIRTELAGVSTAFRRLPKTTAPAGFAQGVARAIAQLPVETTIVFPRRRKVIEWSIAAAAAVLIAVNVIYVIDYRRTEDANPATPPAREERKNMTEQPPDGKKPVADSTLGTKEGEDGFRRDVRASKSGESFDNKAKDERSLEEKRPAGPEVAKNDTERPTMKKGYDDDREVAPQIARQEAPTPESAESAPPSAPQILPAQAKPEAAGRVFSGTEIEIVTIAATDVKAALAKVDEILATNKLASLDGRGREVFRYGVQAAAPGKSGGDTGGDLSADARYLFCDESQRALLLKELGKVGTVAMATEKEKMQFLADDVAKHERSTEEKKDRPSESADELKEREAMLEKAARAQNEEQKKQAHPTANAMPQVPSPAGDKPGIATGGVVTGQRQILIRIIESPQPK